MKKVGLICMLFALLLSACDSSNVKIRGKVSEFDGKAKLMAEMPGQSGMVVLTEQDVKNGDINLETDQLVIPARVWVDLDGKRTLDFIVDSKDMIWIEGKIKFADQIEVKGSGLMQEYDKIQKLLKDKYVIPVEPIQKSIDKIKAKEQMSIEDEMKLQNYDYQVKRFNRLRYAQVKSLIEANPSKELSLFLLQGEMRDSTATQRELFKKMSIENKESNIYKVLSDKLK